MASPAVLFGREIADHLIAASGICMLPGARTFTDRLTAMLAPACHGAGDMEAGLAEVGMRLADLAAGCWHAGDSPAPWPGSPRVRELLMCDLANFNLN